jgi:hypothetical protein
MDIILDMIRRGINVQSFFDYDGQQIPIRAVSSAEIDDARYKSLGTCDNKLAALIVKLRLGLLEGKVNLDDIPVEMYINYVKYIYEFDYWVVYYAMKDFRDSSFCINDVRLMRHVHKIAQEASNMSSTNRNIIDMILKTPEGEEIANCHFNLHIPLFPSLDKGTPLQIEFLKSADPKAPTKIDSMEKLEKLLPIIGDRMRNGR